MLTLYERFIANIYYVQWKLCDTTTEPVLGICGTNFFLLQVYLVRWLKLRDCKVRDRGFETHPGLQVSNKTKCFFLAHSWGFNIVWNLRDR